MTDPWIESLLDALPCGALLVDATGRITRANRAAERLLGRSAGTLLGVDLFEAVGGAGTETTARGLFRAQVREARVALDVECAGRSVRVRGAGAGASFRATALVYASRDDAAPPEPTPSFLAVAREVRHGINNALMGVLGHLELLQIRSDLTPPVRAKVDAIRADAERIRDLVKKLEAFRQP